MLATLDDISNLNLNNLAGSIGSGTLGPRTSIPSLVSRILSLSLSTPLVLPRFASFSPFPRSRFRTCHDIWLQHTHTRMHRHSNVQSHVHVCRSWLIKSLVLAVSTSADEKVQTGEYLDTDRLLILNWSNIYNIVQSRRPGQISPGDRSYRAAVILKNIEPSKCLHVLCPFSFCPSSFFLFRPRTPFLCGFPLPSDRSWAWLKFTLCGSANMSFKVVSLWTCAAEPWEFVYFRIDSRVITFCDGNMEKLGLFAILWGFCIIMFHIFDSCLMTFVRVLNTKTWLKARTEIGDKL